MQIRVTRITNKELLDLACSYTAGHDVVVKNLKKMYLSEHSPIRTQVYAVEMVDIPTFVSVHLVRHKVGVEHYVKSNRVDRGGVVDAGRATPVAHLMVINAQALINMARKRLCGKASRETQAVMLGVRSAIAQIDPDLAECLVSECEYRGSCYEFQSCGRFKKKGSDHEVS